MREQRTFIALIVLCFGLLLVWQPFLNWIWPPPPRAKSDPKKTPDAPIRFDLRQWHETARAAGTALQADLPALGNALNLLTAAHLAYPRVSNRLEDEVISHVVERVMRPNPALSGGLSAGLLLIGTETAGADLRQKALRDVVRLGQVRRAAAAREEITLGDRSSKLEVVLTTLGGGVRSVTLNDFAAADRLGLRSGDRLPLVPGGKDEHGRERPPAFLLFHFPPGAPDDANLRPWDTLGKLDWTVEKPYKTAKTDAGTEIKTEVTFTAEVPGQDIVVSKTYSLAPGDYHLGLTVRIQRKAGGMETVPFRYQLTGGHGLPIEGEWFTTTFRNSLVGQVDARNNLWRNFQESRVISIEQGGRRVPRADDRWIRYAAVCVQFFTSAIVVDTKQNDQSFLQWARPTLPWPDYVTSESRPQLDDITVRVNTRPLELKPDTVVEHKYLLYHGPMKVALLGELTTGSTAVSDDLIRRYRDELRLDTLTDYHYQMEGFPGAMSRFFSAIYWTNVLIACTNLMHWVLGGLYYVIPNYGVCIILLTFIVRLAMFPISKKQAMMSIRMQALAPEMKKLQEKYKDDLQGRQQATMELYRKHGVNPLGSCWVMLLQMPIFMGLYYALQESIHFRLAEFLWIRNLAAPDMLFYWGEGVPWINRPEDQGGFFYLGPFFNLLPLIAIVLMFIHQKLFTPPPADEQQEMQMKMMKYMMIFMGFMFYKVAAGLALYFIISSLWGLAERRILPKPKSLQGGAVQEVKPAKAAAPPKGKGKPEKSKKESNGTMKKVQDWWEEVLRQAKKK